MLTDSNLSLVVVPAQEIRLAPLRLRGGGGGEGPFDPFVNATTGEIFSEILKQYTNTRIHTHTHTRTHTHTYTHTSLPLD